jgi:hypothetical protein
MTVKPTAKTVVVLIHGTFAREAEWTSPEAPCPRTIATDLEGGLRLCPFDGVVEIHIEQGPKLPTNSAN